MGQLAEAKARLASAGTEAEQAKLKIEHGERELKEKEPRAKKAAKEGEGLGRELEQARKEMAELEKKVDGLGWDEQVEGELGKRREVLKGEIDVLTEVRSTCPLSYEPALESRTHLLILSLSITLDYQKRDQLRSRLAQTDFSYSDPTANFDRSKVKGLVANLIELDEKNFDSSTALEICAGGKLYNVIVEDEKVAAALLGNKNSLKKRVTLLPLNKIQPYSISNEVSRYCTVSSVDQGDADHVLLLRARRFCLAHRKSLPPRNSRRAKCGRPSPWSATPPPSPPPCRSSSAPPSSAPTPPPPTPSPTTPTSSSSPSPSTETCTTLRVRSREERRPRGEGCWCRCRRSGRSRRSSRRRGRS